MSVVDRVGTANVQKDLKDDAAWQALRALVDTRVALAGLEEWGHGRDHLLERLESPLTWARPPRAGGPAVFDSSRYRLKTVRGRKLAAAGFVGNLPGRKSRLPMSVASVFVFDDLALQEKVVLLVVHLTAEVQFGAAYRGDGPHRLRVARHQLERLNLELLVRWHQARGRRVYVVGDTNFDQMPLRQLVPCWEGHPDVERRGTLGGRAVDYVYAPDRARKVLTRATASDHRFVVATYAR
jgi:hypothetical protein